MTSCIPSGINILAGLKLADLRTTALYRQMPSAVLAMADAYREADSLLAASTGRDLLIVASGRFSTPPQGTVPLGPGLVIAGPPDLVKAAQSQHETGAAGEAHLVDAAQPLAVKNQIWVVVRGDAQLPLSGNAANINRLMRNMDFAAITLRVQSDIQLGLAARGRSAESALHFEQTLRAFLTMAAAADAREPDVAALLRSVQIRRDERDIRAEISADPALAQKVLALLTP